MNAYASRTGTKRNLEALRKANWRLLVSPAGYIRTEGFRYALDNGAWSAFKAGIPLDMAAFERAVDRIGSGADWVVLPDIVADGEKSLELSLKWLNKAGKLPCLPLLAVQDGMKPEEIAPLVGKHLGIFLGGSTEWKLMTAIEWGQIAYTRGAYFHIGRVNSARRIRIAHAARADSFDGTSASRYAKTLPLLDAARRMPDLFTAQPPAKQLLGVAE